MHIAVNNSDAARMPHADFAIAAVSILILLNAIFPNIICMKYSPKFLIDSIGFYGSVLPMAM
jgi:hypothetical protein